MHISKVKLGDGSYARLTEHMERKHTFYKSDVDKEKSGENIVIKPYVKDVEAYIKKEGVTRIRKDSVGSLNAVCTVADGDKQYLQENPGEYERWGWAVINATLKALNLTQSDVLGAVIHLDEDKSGNVEGGNAHIHFSLAPLVRENGKVTLSAKKVANINAFKILHDKLQAKMTREGFKGVYVNPDMAQRSLSKETLLEYKAAKEANKSLEATRDELQSQIDDLKDDLMGAELERMGLQQELEHLRSDKKQFKKTEQRLKDFEDYTSKLKLKNGQTVLEDFNKQQERKFHIQKQYDR